MIAELHLSRDIRKVKTLPLGDPFGQFPRPVLSGRLNLGAGALCERLNDEQPVLWVSVVGGHLTAGWPSDRI